MSDADKELVDRLMRNLEENQTPGSALVALMKAVVRWSEAVDRLAAHQASLPESSLGAQLATTLRYQNELIMATTLLKKLGAP